jgi:hypothetical protein
LVWVSAAVAVADPSLAQMPVPVAPTGPDRSSEWVEARVHRKYCLETARIRGSIVIDPRTLELAMAGGGRLRLKFGEDCPHLGYYERFYYKPDANGMLCAPRHDLLGREGGRCRIRAIATMKRRS